MPPSYDTQKLKESIFESGRRIRFSDAKSEHVRDTLPIGIRRSWRPGRITQEKDPCDLRLDRGIYLIASMETPQCLINRPGTLRVSDQQIAGLEPAIAIRGIKLLNQGRGGTLGPFIELTYLPDLSQEPRRVEVHLVLGKVPLRNLYCPGAKIAVVISISPKQSAPCRQRRLRLPPARFRSCHANQKVGDPCSLQTLGP